MFWLRNLHQETVFVSVKRFFLLNYSKDNRFQTELLLLENKISLEARIFVHMEDQLCTEKASFA